MHTPPVLTFCSRLGLPLVKLPGQLCQNKFDQPNNFLWEKYAKKKFFLPNSSSYGFYIQNFPLYKTKFSSSLLPLFSFFISFLFRSPPLFPVKLLPPHSNIPFPVKEILPLCLIFVPSQKYPWHVPRPNIQESKTNQTFLQSKNPFCMWTNSCQTPAVYLLKSK